jgi:hypothetical protein
MLDQKFASFLTLSSYRQKPVSTAEVGPGFRRDDEHLMLRISGAGHHHCDAPMCCSGTIGRSKARLRHGSADPMLLDLPTAQGSLENISIA